MSTLFISRLLNFQTLAIFNYIAQSINSLSFYGTGGHKTHLLLFSNQLVNPDTSSPADDVHHYVIPPKLLLTNRFYFQRTSGIHAPVGKRKGGSLSGRIPASIADSCNVATIARKHSVLNLREINRNNTHTALASVFTDEFP
jgi:hypothetical protein